MVVWIVYFTTLRDTVNIVTGIPALCGIPPAHPCSEALADTFVGLGPISVFPGEGGDSNRRMYKTMRFS